MLFPNGRVLCCDGIVKVDVGIFRIVVHIDNLAVGCSSATLQRIGIMAHLGEVVARGKKEEG